MPGDVVDLILQDHEEFKRMLAVLRSEPDQRSTVIPVLTTLVSAHERAEEAVVYPAARDEAGEEDEVAHSQEEHIEADQLLAKLARADPTSSGFEATLEELAHALTHHLDEEETTVLPGLRERLSDQRRAELGEAFLAERTAHLGDQPDDIRKSELEQQASNTDLPGASDMNKDQLVTALRDKAEG